MSKLTYHNIGDIYKNKDGNYFLAILINNNYIYGYETINFNAIKSAKVYTINIGGKDVFFNIEFPICKSLSDFDYEYNLYMRNNIELVDKIHIKKLLEDQKR